MNLLKKKDKRIFKNVLVNYRKIIENCRLPLLANYITVLFTTEHLMVVHFIFYYIISRRRGNKLVIYQLNLYHNALTRDVSGFLVITALFLFSLSSAERRSMETISSVPRIAATLFPLSALPMSLIKSAKPGKTVSKSVRPCCFSAPCHFFSPSQLIYLFIISWMLLNRIFPI